MKDELIRDIVAAATMAPSIHNSQPWRFVVQGNRLDLFADRSRSLVAADPSGRQLHISCGAALLNARVKASSLGFRSRVSLLADSADPDHLASLLFEPNGTPAVDETLAPAIELRHTERDVFDPRPLPDDLIETFQQAVGSEGAWLRRVSAGEEEVVLAVLLARADEAELSDAGYRVELRRWVHADSSVDSEEVREGITAGALPATRPQGRASSLRLRDFTPEAGALEATDVPPPAEHPFVAIIGTAEDDRYSWLQAGQALGRLLLTATLAGVGASPLTQVLDLPSYRERLTLALGLLGHPQMILRLGYGHGGGPTPRRDVNEVLTIRPAHPVAG
jgi:nitroreductase